MTSETTPVAAPPPLDPFLLQDSDEDGPRDSAPPAALTVEASPVNGNGGADPVAAKGIAPDSPAGRVYTYCVQVQGEAHMPAMAKAAILNRFLGWCAARGWTPTTMPAHALQQAAPELWSPQGQNGAAERTLKTLATMRALGMPVTEQQYTKIRVPPQARAHRPAPPTEGVEPQYSTQPLLTVEPEPQRRAPPPLLDVPSTAHLVPPPAQRQMAKPRANTFLPQGGRIRVSRQATGYEAPGIGPGTRITVGEYPLEDITESRVQDFLLRHIVPRYASPHDTVYLVEKLGAGGNPVEQYTFPFAGTPGAPLSGAPAYPMGMVQQPQQPQFAMPPAQGGQEQFVSYLMEKDRVGTERYEKLRAEMLAANEAARKSGGGIETMMMLQQLERMRPAPVDYAEAARAFQAQSGGGGKLLGELFGAPGQQPGQELAPTAAASTQTSLVEALASTAERAMEMATRQRTEVTPTAEPIDPVRQLAAVLEVLGPILRPPPAADPNTPMVQMLRDTLQETRAELREYRSQILNKPTRGVLEQLGELKGLVETFREIQGDTEPGPSIGQSVADVIEAVASNADKIGTMVNAFQGRAPALPPRAEQKTLPAGKTAAAPVLDQHTLPDSGKQALLLMRDAPPGEAGDQAVANALYTLIFELSKAEDPHWQKLAGLVVQGYSEAGSKPELRSIVTSLFLKCGAKPLAQDEALVEKVTDVLHLHYSVLYSHLNPGKTKVLTDAPKAVAATTVPAAVVVEAAAEEKHSDESAEDDDEDDDDEDNADETGDR